MKYTTNFEDIVNKILDNAEPIGDSSIMRELTRQAKTIRRTHTDIEADLVTDSNNALYLEWVISAYGFLLPRGETTWLEFSELIKKHYSLDNPVNETAYMLCVNYYNN